MQGLFQMTVEVLDDRLKVRASRTYRIRLEIADLCSQAAGMRVVWFW